MNKAFIKFACFLTGYNYNILRNCSEASMKVVKKNFSALLIISVIWAFIGYTFATRYVGAGVIVSAVVAIIMVFIVINIERQIILNIKRRFFPFAFRAVIAIVMAVIGAVIVDQIIFREDVEKRKVSSVQEEVNVILPNKTKQLDKEIMQLDSMIQQKDRERLTIMNEVGVQPFIKTYTSSRKAIPLRRTDSTGMQYDTLAVRSESTVTEVENPKAKLIPALDEQFSRLLAQKSEEETQYTTMRADLEAELKSRTGFLDEIVILKEILMENPVALFIWSCIFLFFLCIELFILVNKGGDGKDQNDYDALVLHQQEMRKRELGKLSAEKKPVAYAVQPNPLVIN